MRSMRRILVSLGLIVLLAAPASGRSEKTLAYMRDQVWPTAVRFLVVDEGAKILEKDADAGYALFELRDRGKLYRGSLEVLTIVKDGRTSVRFVINLIDRPSWMEIAMLTRLEQKLRSELGSPSPAPTPKPKEPPKEPPKDKEPAPKDEPPISRTP